MSDRKRLFVLIAIMTSVSLIVGGIAVLSLYRTAMNASLERLTTTAQRQARLIEAIARFDGKFMADYPGGAEAATLSQITDSHKNFTDFGKSGEFALAKLDGDRIVWLLSHRNTLIQKPDPTPFDLKESGGKAEPMRQALSGKSGTMVGTDYRGTTVLAAYEPVDVLNMGIVAKIDIAEVRAPFIRTAAIGLGVALVVVFLGSLLFLRVSNPIIVRLQELVDTTREEIRERVHAEDALRESETRIRAIVNTAVDGIVTIDEKGIVESLNPAAEGLFGYAAGEVIGQNISMLMPNPYQREHDGYLANYLRTSTARIIGIGREVVGLRKDGSTFPMDLAVSEFRIGERRMFTGIVRDISKRKELESEVMNISTFEQQRIGQDLHDGLGQELTGIALLAGVLQKRLADKDVPESKNAGEIGDLVNQTIDHTKALVKGLCPVALETEGLMIALRDLADTVRDVYGVSCSCDCQQPILIDDHTKAMHLYYIANEAVNNSIRHGKAKRIVISTKQQNGNVSLAVSDDGAGIPDESIRKRGSGLRIMNYRARMIGGSLEIRLGPGGGTIVRCSFNG